MRRFGIAIAALGMMTGVAFAEADVTLKIGTGDYPPFTDATAPDGGSVNRVVKKMATAAGFDVAFEYMPWKRALELARSGRMHATSFWYHKQEREADFIHVGPIFKDRLVFFRRADMDKPDWTKLEDLKGLKIGAVNGYTYTPEFWELAEEGVLEVEEAHSDEANFRKLMAGRIDLFPMSEESGSELVMRIFNDNQHSRIVFGDKPLAETEGFLLVSRSAENAEDLATRLQRALGTLETASN
jgi:polar amino acid transport system substrate-binding protein